MRKTILVCVLALAAGCKNKSETAPAAATGSGSAAAPAPAPSPSPAPVEPAPAPAPAQAKVDLSQPATLVPGTSIGPFKLGMTRADVTAMGVDLKTASGSTSTTGPYELTFDESDRLTGITRRLATNQDGSPVTGSLVIDGKTVDPATTHAALAKMIPGCKPIQINEGGNTAECDNHTFALRAGPPGIVEVRVESPAK